MLRLAGYLSKYGHNAEYFDPNVFIVTGTGVSIDEKLAADEAVTKATYERPQRSSHLAGLQ